MTPANYSVSVLIPVYNRQDLIGPCIQSALDQTLSPLEIVVVDNASTDATREVCRNYARRDERVRVFCNASNIGPVRNWLRCMVEEHGEYGKLLFSDDLIYLILPAKCARQYTDRPVWSWRAVARHLVTRLRTLRADAPREYFGGSFK